MNHCNNLFEKERRKQFRIQVSHPTNPYLLVRCFYYQANYCSPTNWFDARSDMWWCKPVCRLQVISHKFPTHPTLKLTSAIQTTIIKLNTITITFALSQTDSSSNQPGDSDRSSLSGGQIGGIILGVFGVLMLVMLIGLCALSRLRTLRNANVTPLESNPPDINTLDTVRSVYLLLCKQPKFRSDLV